MGKEPNRVADREPTAQDVRRLEREIEESRRRLSDVVAELDHRRHNLLSPRRGPGMILAVSASAVLGGVAFLAARLSRRNRRRRAGRLADALTRVYRHPERVASDRKSSLTKIGIAVLPALLKIAADRALERRAER